MKTYNCPQYSKDWWELKRGVASASCASEIITPKNGQLSTQSVGYICELISQRLIAGDYWLNGSDYQSIAMANGSVTEQEARRCYEFERDTTVDVVGFCLTDDGRFGCSPDGLIGEDGGLEIKCPTPKIHVRYLFDGKLPDAYKPQVHFSLAITGRKWWDFYSYAPGLESFCLRVERDDYTEAVAKALDEFWIQYQEMYARLTRKAA